MKLNKEEKEIEDLFESGAIKLRKPDKAFLKQLILLCYKTSWIVSFGT